MEFRQEWFGRCFGEADGQHASEAGGLLLDPATVIGHADRVLEVENSRHEGRAHLADAVPDDRGRLDTAIAPQRRKRCLHDEVGRLRDVRFRHARRGFIRLHLGEDRPARQALEDGVAFLGDPAKHRLGAQQLASHGPPLGAHAGEHEDGPLVACAASPDGHALGIEVFHERLQLPVHGLARACNHG